MSKRSRSLSMALAATVLSVAAMPALAVTDEQKQTLRTNCRSDFIAHCKGVSPGGVPAFECLAKNVSSLSPSCQAAVKAVDPAVE